MIEFRKVRLSESKIIAKIHTETFKNSFLTSLGSNFLKTYYEACIKSKETICLCAVKNNNNIVGFCFGTLYSKGFSKRLILSNFFPFTIQFIIIFFSNPSAIIRLIKNLDKGDNRADDGSYAELVSIGVLNKNKGLGIGKNILSEFEKYVSYNNVTRICLTTDTEENNYVLKFYKSMGYKIFYEFITHPNRKMYKLFKNII